MGLPTQADPYTPIKQRRADEDASRRSSDLAERKRVANLRDALQHRPTRAVLAWLLSQGRGRTLCPNYPTFDPNAMQMAKREGARELLAVLWDELALHCPAELVLLQNEAMEP